MTFLTFQQALDRLAALRENVNITYVDGIPPKPCRSARVANFRSGGRLMRIVERHFKIAVDCDRNMLQLGGVPRAFPRDLFANIPRITGADSAIHVCADDIGSLMSRS